MFQEKGNRFTALFHEAKEYLELKIEYARLTAAEKVTVLLTATALAAVATLLGFAVLFFLMIAVAHWLGLMMSMALAYTIVTGFFLLLLVLVFVLRRQLIYDPVSRFISKLFLQH